MVEWYSGKGAAAMDGLYGDEETSAMQPRAAMPTAAMKSAAAAAARHNFDSLTRPSHSAKTAAAPGMCNPPTKACDSSSIKTGASAVNDATPNDTALPTATGAGALTTACGSPDDGCGDDDDEYGGGAIETAATAFSTSALPTGPYAAFISPGPTGHGDAFVSQVIIAPRGNLPIGVEGKLDRATMALNAELLSVCPGLKGLQLSNPGHVEHSFERVFTFRWTAALAEAAGAGGGYRCCLPVFVESGASFPSVRDIVGSGLGRGPCGIGSQLSVLREHTTAMLQEHALDRLINMKLDNPVPSSHAVLSAVEILEYENKGSCPVLLQISGVRNHTVLDSGASCAAWIPAESRALVSMPLRPIQSVASEETYATFGTMNPDAEARYVLSNSDDNVRRDDYQLSTNMTYFLRTRLEASADPKQAVEELFSHGISVGDQNKPYRATAAGVEYVQKEMHKYKRGISMLAVNGPKRAVAEIVMDGTPNAEAVEVMVRVRFDVRYPYIMGTVADLLGMALQQSQPQVVAKVSGGGGGGKKKKKKAGNR